MREIGIVNVEGGINEVWESVTNNIRSVVKEVLGESRAKMPEDKKKYGGEKRKREEM